MTYETHLDKARQSKKKHNELRLIRTRKPVSEAGLGEFVQGGGGKASTSGWWAHTAVLVARTLPPPRAPVPMPEVALFLGLTSCLTVPEL